MGSYVSNLVHGVLNGVELEVVYNFFISYSIAVSIESITLHTVSILNSKILHIMGMKYFSSDIASYKAITFFVSLS